MTTLRMVNAIGFLDEDLIAEASTWKAKNRRSAWLKWGFIAAGFLAVLIACAILVPPLLHREKQVNPLDERYKDFAYFVEAVGTLWPWEYRTVGEQYRYLTVDEKSYEGTARTVSEELVGERVGEFTVTGYGYERDDVQVHSMQVETFVLKCISKDWYLAAKMEGEYYVFKNTDQIPAKNLGELLDQVDLPKIITLRDFTEEIGYQTVKQYTLNDDSGIWKILTEECRDAGFVEGNLWNDEKREKLSFTITSESLGVYKVAMYVTTDGYLWTNAFQWPSIFGIGREAAEKIIQYAKEHSTASEYTPYLKAVYGKVSQVTDEYVLIDDSELCNDPTKGIVYKVLLNDLRITRYFETGNLKLGDDVAIFYEGDMADEKEHAIDSAISAQQIWIQDQSTQWIALE